MLKEKDFNSIPLLSVNYWEQYVKLYTTARTSYKCAWYHSSTFRTQIPEERPEFVVKQFVDFFGGANTDK